jgi:hypothetical protein
MIAEGMENTVEPKASETCHFQGLSFPRVRTQSHSPSLIKGGNASLIRKVTA